MDFSDNGHDFAVRHGRIEIMECDHLKYPCTEHLGLDVPHEPADATWTALTY